MPLENPIQLATNTANTVKSSLTCAVLSAITLYYTGCAPSFSNSDSLEFIVSQGTVKIHGVEHQLPLHIDALVEAIGPPDYTSHLINTVSTWDNLGIIAYQEKQSSLVHAIHLSFAREDHSFSPNEVFKGTLEYNQVVFSTNTTRQDLYTARLAEDQVSDDYLYFHVQDDLAISVTFESGLISFSIETTKIPNP